MSHDITVQHLRDYLDCYDPDLPIRLATQPSYPLASHILDRLVQRRGVVYILEADQVYSDPYLPKSLWTDEPEPCSNCFEPAVGAVTLESGEENFTCHRCLEVELPTSVATTFRPWKGYP